MIYLTSFFYIIAFLYITENAKAKNFLYYSLLILPAFVIYALPLSLQYDVGTDYKNYYYYGESFGYYYLKHKQEYLWFYLFNAINKYKLNPQLTFLFSAVLNSFLLFLSIYLLKKENYKTWLLVLLMFLATGNYQNQMNVLRQYVGVFATIPILIYFLNSNWLKSILLSLIGLFSHKSFFVVVFFTLATSLIKKRISKKAIPLVIFILSIPFYLFFLPMYAEKITDLVLPNYLHYIESDYGSFGIIQLLSRLHIIPLYLLFLLIYYKGNRYRTTFIQKHKNFEIYIFIWSITCFYYLLAIKFQPAGRFIYYFEIFKIFPLYYIFSFLHHKKKNLTLILVFLYLFIPYVVKVLLLPSGEYLYESIIFS